MKRKTQYQLKIKNGEIVTEEGHFFPAIPFEIHSEKSVISCTFSHKDHEVVYQLIENNTILATLEHPDYTPTDDPENISSIISCLQTSRWKKICKIYS